MTATIDVGNSPAYALFFEVDMSALPGPDPVEVRIPWEVKRDIRQYFHRLGHDEEPDLEQFNLPEGLTLRVEKLSPTKQALIIFDDDEVEVDSAGFGDADRCRNYVPTKLRLPAPWEAEWTYGEWDEETSTSRQVNDLRPLSYGLADQFNRDRGTWDWIDTSKDKDGSHWSHFVGHREQVDVRISTANRRNTNDWKGRDEVKGSTEWEVWLDRVQVGGDTWWGDPLELLIYLRKYIRDMSCGGLGGHGKFSMTSWRHANELIGRKVYYRDTPAIVDSLILEQGCCMLVADTVDGRFPPPGWAQNRDGEEADLFYDDVAPGEKQRIKIELRSDAIYWHRD